MYINIKHAVCRQVGKLVKNTLNNQPSKSKLKMLLTNRKTCFPMIQLISVCQWTHFISLCFVFEIRIFRLCVRNDVMLVARHIETVTEDTGPVMTTCRSIGAQCCIFFMHVFPKAQCILMFFPQSSHIVRFHQIERLTLQKLNYSYRFNARYHQTARKKCESPYMTKFWNHSDCKALTVIIIIK